MPIPRRNPAPRGEELPIIGWSTHDHWYVPKEHALPASIIAMETAGDAHLVALVDALNNVPWFTMCNTHLLPMEAPSSSTLVQDVKCLFCMMPVGELMDRQPLGWPMTLHEDHDRNVVRLVGARAIGVIAPHTYRDAGSPGAGVYYTVLERSLPLKLY